MIRAPTAVPCCVGASHAASAVHRTYHCDSSSAAILRCWGRTVSSFLTAHQHIIGHFSAMGAQTLGRTPHTCLMALFPGLPGWASTRKVKPIWILLKQETVSGISCAICKSAPCSRQITTPATHHSVFYRPDALPAAQPTASKHWTLSPTILRFCTWILPVKSFPFIVRCFANSSSVVSWS